MNKAVTHSVSKSVDSIQQHLVDYAVGLDYHDLPPEVSHAAKVRVIDELGALIAGFFGEPLQIARGLAAQMPITDGATVIGTRMKTTPDMAAFVNASNAHYVEMADVYHWPGDIEKHQLLAPYGHPGDVVTPVLAVAEYAKSGGRDFITGIVLAYEVFCRMADVFNNPAFDYTNFVCLGTAVAGGKLFGLSPQQLAHCISMAIVPNVALTQEKGVAMSMWKEMASGQAGRAGVFAALLARAGMEGPHLPFEGKAGWCDHVARERISLGAMGGKETRFKILDTLIKNRPAAGSSNAPILAAEKVAPLKDIKAVKHVKVEIYKRIKGRTDPGTPEILWNPDNRGAANHSFAYVVAATLMEGTVTTRSFDDAHLRNPELRALMDKIDVVTNDEFNRAYHRLPQQHRARVTVVIHSGERLVGEAGHDDDDLSTAKTDAQVEAKFRGVTEEFLGAKRVNSILDCLWHLEELGNVAEIPPAFVLD